jgi:hypothetical protein
MWREWKHILLSIGVGFAIVWAGYGVWLGVLWLGR